MPYFDQQRPFYPSVSLCVLSTWSLTGVYHRLYRQIRCAVRANQSDLIMFFKGYAFSDRDGSTLAYRSGLVVTANLGASLTAELGTSDEVWKVSFEKPGIRVIKLKIKKVPNYKKKWNGIYWAKMVHIIMWEGRKVPDLFSTLARLVEILVDGQRLPYALWWNRAIESIHVYLLRELSNEHAYISDPRLTP